MLGKKVSLSLVAFIVASTAITGCSSKMEMIDAEVCDLNDHFYSIDEKYAANDVVKISADSMEIEVDYEGNQVSGVKNNNDRPEAYGDLIVDAEYIFGGGPKPPENNYYLKRHEDGWYTIKNCKDKIQIRLVNGSIYSIECGIYPIDYNKGCNGNVSFTVNGDMVVSGEETNTIMSWKCQNLNYDWIYIDNLCVNTSIRYNGIYFELQNEVDGESRIQRSCNGHMTTGRITLVKGKSYRIYSENMCITDENGNELESKRRGR